MTTVLQYLVIAAVIALVLFGLALLLFGRGEQMPPLAARTSPASLPSQGIQGDDVRLVKFSLAVRGYRMSDVDWTLDRLAEELDRTKIRLAELEGGSATVAIPDAAHIQTPLATDKHAAAVTVVAAAVSDDLFVNDVAPGEFAPTVELSQGSAPFEIASPTEEGPQ